MQKLTAVTNNSSKSRHYNQNVPLEVSAARLYPESEHNRAAWIRAIRYMRRRAPSIWQLDTRVSASSNIQRY